MSRTLELILGIVSVVLFVATLATIPWLVRRLPVDYFVRLPPKHPLPVLLLRNVLGFALIAAGIAMLVLPGQGILTILVGVSIVDLPVKHRIMRWLLRRPKVQEYVQLLRSKGGKPPLVIPRA